MNIPFSINGIGSRNEGLDIQLALGGWKRELKHKQPLHS